MSDDIQDIPKNYVQNHDPVQVNLNEAFNVKVLA